jgi:nucleoside-diphosphate-sugar epimerase
VVLVTGAGGFIGRWSVPPLLAAGFDVHAVCARTAVGTRPSPAADSSLGALQRATLQAATLRGASLHVADLLEAAEIDALLDAVQPTHLLHFAWIATPGVYWTSPDNRRWLTAGRHLLREFARRGGSRAVMAGSCAEYDWTRVGVCHERSSPLADEAGGIAEYAECKIAMQRALADLSAAEGLSSAWGRIFFQYGPGEHPARLVSSVIVNLLSGREAPCSHGRQIRSFLHVADVGGAFARLLDSDLTGPVNIGSAEPQSIADLLGDIAAQIGAPQLLRLGVRAVPPAEPALLVPDVTRLNDELGWRPAWSSAAGLADTIDWWRRALEEGAAAPIVSPPPGRQG